MQRREFIKWLSLLLMSGVSGHAMANSNPLNKKKIAVVGAGISGLAAARELKRQGHDVFIIEARDRIGGRIWTSNKWADLPVDLGATWIHGTRGNPITDLANQIQAKRLVTEYDKAITYNSSGKALNSSETRQLEQLSEQISQALEKAQNANQDVSLRQVIDTLGQKFNWPHDTQIKANFIINSELEQEYSGSASQLSAYWFDADKELRGDDALFVQGYQLITQFLAEGLSIKLGQTVKSIHWGDSDVKLVTDKDEFSVDHVIVTLPLGVLKAGSVQFIPELPVEKQEAIKQLGMGVLNKCYLRFSDAFWPNDVDWLEYIPENHGAWSEWVSFKRVADVPVLLGFNAADRGKEIEAWSDAEIVESAMHTLRTIYGQNIPQPLDYQITRWNSDPYAYGSYSFNALGMLQESRAKLAQPVSNQLFFAGEATHSDYFGTVHGAYLSGIKVSQLL